MGEYNVSHVYMTRVLVQHSSTVQYQPWRTVSRRVEARNLGIAYSDVLVYSRDTEAGVISYPRVLAICCYCCGHLCTVCIYLAKVLPSMPAEFSNISCHTYQAWYDGRKV